MSFILELQKRSMESEEKIRENNLFAHVVDEHYGFFTVIEYARAQLAYGLAVYSAADEVAPLMSAVVRIHQVLLPLYREFEGAPPTKRGLWYLRFDFQFAEVIAYLMALASEAQLREFCEHSRGDDDSIRAPELRSKGVNNQELIVIRFLRFLWTGDIDRAAAEIDALPSVATRPGPGSSVWLSYPVRKCAALLQPLLSEDCVGVERPLNLYLKWCDREIGRRYQSMGDEESDFRIASLRAVNPIAQVLVRWLTARQHSFEVLHPSIIRPQRIYGAPSAHDG